MSYLSLIVMIALFLQTVFSCLLVCPVIFVESQTLCILANRNQGEQTFSVRIYVNMARSWAMLNFCCSCRYQRFKILLVSLFLSFPLDFGLSQVHHLRDSLYLALL